MSASHSDTKWIVIWNFPEQKGGFVEERRIFPCGTVAVNFKGHLKDRNVIVVSPGTIFKHTVPVIKMGAKT